MAYLSRRHRFQIPSDSEWRSFISLRRSLLEHEDELTALLQRPAQVNDFRRCVGLYPGLLFAAQRVSKPIALVEVGPSLGLNLCLDLYCYEYSGLGEKGATSNPDVVCLPRWTILHREGVRGRDARSHR